MKSIIFLALFCALTTAFMIPFPLKLVFKNPPRYQIDIDGTPRQRWEPVMKDFKAPLTVFINHFDKVVPIPKAIFEAFSSYGHTLFKYQKYVREIQAISDLTDLPFDTLFTLNFMYELASWKSCTGVIARSNSGNIYHGRNLDFEFFRYFANLTLTIDYQRKGKTLFSVDGLAGAIFFHSGVKPGHFGVTQTTRKASSLWDNLRAIVAGNLPSVWLVKEVLENQNNFEDAVRALNETKIACPIYYMASGPKPNDGVVIERNTESIHAFYQLNETTTFLVQTNYDRDLPDPWNDRRRIPAQDRVAALDGNINNNNLMEAVMMKYPTLNMATVCSTVINPLTGYFNTSTWW